MLYTKYDYIVGTSSIVLAIIASLIKCAYEIGETKRIKKEAELHKKELEEHMKHIHKAEASQVKKEVEDLNKQLVELLNKIPEKKEKEPIPVRSRLREIPIEKVEKMMAQYGLTVEDFRRDFPNAIIIE